MTEPESTPPRRRGFGSAGDMVRSMGVIVVIVLVIFIVQIRNDPSPVRRVSISGALKVARSQAPYAVAGPVGLPRTWRATSVRFGGDGAPTSWHIGYVTPDGDYAALEQGPGNDGSVLDRVSDRGSSAGSVDINGVTWKRVQGGSPEPRALVRTGTGPATVVAGRATWTELGELAAAGRP